MKLNIKYEQTTNLVKINFAKELIEINLNKDDAFKNVNWNTKDINSFLIKIASTNPNNEDVVVEYDGSVENKVYQHIVNIFSTFANTYNQNLK